MVLSKTCGLAFEIVSLKVFFEQGGSNQSFPVKFWMEGIVCDYEKSFVKTFPFFGKGCFENFPIFGN
jgi:hypothetical protein